MNKENYVADKCDAMGHYGGDPKPEGKCPKCGKNWDVSSDSNSDEASCTDGDSIEQAKKDFAEKNGYSVINIGTQGWTFSKGGVQSVLGFDHESEVLDFIFQYQPDATTIFPNK